MSSAPSVGVIYDDKPLVQLRKEDKLANHSSQRNNASEEQPLRQCWGPRNIVALSDKGLRKKKLEKNEKIVLEILSFNILHAFKILTGLWQVSHFQHKYA